MAIPEEIQEKVLAEATSATPTFSIDMNDQQFKDVDATIKGMEDELDNTYAGQIGGADQFYKDLQDESQRWADEQVELQKQQTDLAIEKIEQQKAQAEKDYIKEQSGAYVDWQKQSNAYGVNAEKMASAGLTNTGYSESSQVSMYNAYQNRVATAREVMARAKQEYENNINQAILQNSVAMAEIYANAYKEQLQLTLDNYLHNQELVLELYNKKVELENTKWNRYKDVYNRLFSEAQMAEDIRQYQETMKWNTEQKELDRQHDKDLEEIKFGYEKDLKEIQHGYDTALAEINKNYEIEIADAKTQNEIELAEYKHGIALRELEAKRKQEEKLLKYEYDLKNQPVGTVSGSGNYSNTGKKTNNTGTFSASKGYHFATYNEACIYLNAMGGDAASLMTPNEWSRRKAAYKNTGQGSTEVKNYSTYQQYMNDYVYFLLSGK